MPFLSTNIPFFLGEACDFSLEIDFFPLKHTTSHYKYTCYPWKYATTPYKYAEFFLTARSIVGKCVHYNKALLSSGRSRLTMQKHKRTCSGSVLVSCSRSDLLPTTDGGFFWPPCTSQGDRVSWQSVSSFKPF